MILSALLILAFIGNMFFFNRRNKFLNVIAMYFVSVMVIMLMSILFVSRFSNYSFPLRVDYELYLSLSKMHVHVNTLVRICNLAIGLFIFATIYLIKLIKGYSWKYLAVYSTVIIGEFLITNSPKFKWDMYLKINTSRNLSWFYSDLMIFLRYFNICVLFVIALAPFVYLTVYYRETKIPLKKRNALTYMACLAVMEIYIYAIFVIGPFKQFMFFELDMLSFPAQNDANYSYLSTPVISLVIVLFFVFIFLVFKPFNSLVVLRKKEMLKNSRMMNKNIRMILHIYKNSFLGIEKKTQIGMILAKEGETSKAVRQFEDIQKSSLQSVKKIERMLDILREPTMVYDEVYLADVISGALSKMSFEDKIELEKDSILDDILVLADEEHLTEVFVNLLTNAYEAIERKGKNGGLIKIGMDAEADMVTVNVFDNGCGIERKNYKEIFKPFYSTKKASECGGVGLDYVERIIKNHNGEIYVKSKVNEYTLFQIVLPILRRESKNG